MRITDTLPVSITFGSASAGCSQASGVVVCTLTSLAAGASRSFVITTTASAGLPEGTSLENRAIVGSSTPDGNASNNTATADTSIVGAADLTISKVGSPASVVAGGTVTYTIRITNTGPGLARQRGCEGPAAGRLDLSLNLSLGRRRLRRDGVPVRHAPRGRDAHGHPHRPGGQ